MMGAKNELTNKKLTARNKHRIDAPEEIPPAVDERRTGENQARLPERKGFLGTQKHRPTLLFSPVKSELRFIIANDTHLMVVAFAKSYHADLNKF